jgi:hypothetical protein
MPAAAEAARQFLIARGLRELLSFIANAVDSLKRPL